MFLREQLFINIGVSSLGVNNSGICGGIPSCCIAAPCEEIPSSSPEAWDTLLSDDGDIPVSEVGEIGMGTGSTQIKESVFLLEMLCFHNLVLTYAYICTVEQKSRWEKSIGEFSSVN